MNLKIINFMAIKSPPKNPILDLKVSCSIEKKQVRHNNRNLRQDEKNADLDLQNLPVTLDY